MPLQNRVDPFGEIHAVADRGLFTGNRGVLHDPATKTLLERRWTTKAWIICDLVHPRGVRREVMGRNTPSGNAGWTELFFLDEVTALAAGHRPCFYCQRDRAVEFARCFAAGQGRENMSAPEMDEILHAERLASSGNLIDIDRKTFKSLPDAAMVFQGERRFAKHRGALRAWTFWGWGDAWDFVELSAYDVWAITPPSTVAALRAGYRPVWHSTA